MIGKKTSPGRCGEATTWLGWLAAAFLVACNVFAADGSAADFLERLGWRAALDRPDAWKAMPSWLGNPCSDAVVRRTSIGLAFLVPERGKGMKWSRRCAPVWLPETPFLILKYRARNVDTTQDDYAVYLDDRGKTELHAVRLDQLKNDGKWRRIAVDVRSLTRRETVVGLALQVQAAGDNAELDVAELRFAPAPPAGVELLGESRTRPTRLPPYRVPLEVLNWTHRPGWLSNPVADARDVPASTEPAFKVSVPGRGMKWDAVLPRALPLRDYRYMVLTYRAVGLDPRNDYVVCALGTPAASGLGYTPLVMLKDLQADGRRRTLVADITRAGRAIPVCTVLAVQVQATKEASLTISGIEFSQERPKLSIADFAPVRPGADFGKNYAALPLGSAPRYSLDGMLQHLGIGDWPRAAPRGGKMTVLDVPFDLGSDPRRAPGIPLGEEGRVRLPVSGRMRELYVLTLAVLTGAEEPVYGAGRLTAIREIDRFLARIYYRRGAPTEALPYNLASETCELRTGLQVLCVPVDSSREPTAIEFETHTPQTALAVCGLTALRSGSGRWPEPLPQVGLPPSRPSPPRRLVDVRISQDAVTFVCSRFEARLQLRPTLRLVGFKDRVSSKELLHGTTPPLLELLSGKDGEPPAPATLTAAPVRTLDGVRLECACRAIPGIRMVVTIRVGEPDATRPERLVFDLEMRRTEPKVLLPGVRFPRIGALQLSASPSDVWVLFPSRGAVFTNRPVELSGYYSGYFPLQFMSAAAPRANQGVCLITEDQAGVVERSYRLRKDDDGRVHLALEYPAFEDQGLGDRQAATTWVTPTGGDWRAGFNLYRKWLDGWYRPAAPRKQWFREIFNFRQRFLHRYDPLYDRTTGRIDLLQALEEGRRCFGGIEYLHLFDWGNCGKYGRIYGRVGDYSPYDFIKGGRQALANAIAELQKRGVPVGLYIEGYLLQEKGKLGRTHGKEWQIRDRNARGRYWPDSTEMFICPAVAPWRRIQAETYARKVQELDVSGMYIDEFGFCNVGKKCWSPNHGHPVPSFPVRAERGCTKAIRAAVDGVKPGVALYTEETPCDVNTQYQDGSFSYSIRQALLRRHVVPLNLTRFAIPSFKVFQILVCDKPTSTCAGGVAAVFFNGDGIWLEGPGDEWFHPRTLAMIRKCHAILRRYREAFTCNDPEPLVPTEAGGVFANRFAGSEEDVYTLFNSRFCTWSGPVLRFPHRDGVVYLDAWRGCSIVPERRGQWDIVSTSIGPRSVGCIVRRKRQ